jgi:uncharacterized membrane protein YdjX (TVP38/TMEM64 family)
VAVLLLGLALFLLLDLERYFSFEMLSHHHATLTAWVAGHVALAAFLFVVVYTLVVAFSLPIAVIITPVGGFLFGLWWGALLSVIGGDDRFGRRVPAARTAFPRSLSRLAPGALACLDEGLRRATFSYLLFLRLVPVFPFGLVNIVPALLGVALGPYMLATLIGIIPGAVVYSSVGSGLGMLIDRGEMPNLGIIFEWRILLPLLGLAVLALVPVLYTHLRARKTSP